MTLKLLQFQSQMSAMKVRKQCCGVCCLAIFYVFMLGGRQFGATGDTGDTVMVMIQFFPALNGYK